MEENMGLPERLTDQCADAGSLPALAIGWIGGNCPVQSEGTVNGVPYYFRARGKHWEMAVGEKPVDISCGFSEGFYYEEAYGDGPYDAGWMPEDEARQFIAKGASLYLEGLPPAPVQEG